MSRTHVDPVGTADCLVFSFLCREYTECLHTGKEDE